MATSASIPVGIIGASGFTGAELLRLCHGHPGFDIGFATGASQAGESIAELYPSLAPAFGSACYDSFDPADLSMVDGVDLVFLGLPHGASQEIVPLLDGRDCKIVDLGADFRLRDPSLYPSWYGAPHSHPELLEDFVFGLPELFRSRMVGASRVAAPGCYVTTAALTLAPLLAAGVVEPMGIIVDAASGVSGAGRPAKANTTFCSVDENFSAYGLLDHRHTPEIEQALTDACGSPAQVLFTPHLAPMNRGILATCYARPTGGHSTDELLDIMATAYRDEPFIVVSERPPSTKATLGSNAVHLTVRRDERTGWILALGALDNLVKGASGQAIQCANIICGLDETAGLSPLGLYP